MARLATSISGVLLMIAVYMNGFLPLMAHVHTLLTHALGGSA